MSLTIYNILGEAITTLINENLRAGSYKIDWNGIDKSGCLMPSGIYFYQLKNEDFSLAKKMILLK